MTTFSQSFRLLFRQSRSITQDCGVPELPGKSNVGRISFAPDSEKNFLQTFLVQSNGFPLGFNQILLFLMSGSDVFNTDNVFVNVLNTDNVFNAKPLFSAKSVFLMMICFNTLQLM